MSGKEDIGLITEQGDMGLGFDPLSLKDQQTLKENSLNQSGNDDDESKGE